MVKISADISRDVSKQLDRVVREGWFIDEETVIREAIEQFVGSKSFLGDTPRMLNRFAADALNDSKPEVALKFADRGIALASSHDITDFVIYQSLIEIRVQILLVLGREEEALTSLNEAREKMPNNPSIAKWIEKLGKTRPQGEA